MFRSTVMLTLFLTTAPVFGQGLAPNGPIIQNYTMGQNPGAAFTASIKSPGSGINGPQSAQVGYSVNVQKPNWWSGPWGYGEIDGIYVTVRQGGVNSDASGILVDVQNEGLSFLAATEMVSNIVNTTTNTFTYGIDLQQGVLNQRTGDYIGGVVTATHGNLSVGYLVQSNAGSSWGSSFRARDSKGTVYFDVDGSGNISGNSINLRQTTPKQNSSCSAGTMTADSNYIYVCVAANTWRRAVLVSY